VGPAARRYQLIAARLAGSSSSVWWANAGSAMFSLYVVDEHRLVFAMFKQKL